MTTTMIAGSEIEVNEDGFMLNPDQWNPEVAAELALDAGIDPLTDKHWEVLDYCRRDNATKGTPPGVRRITKNTGISMKEMYSLFPGGPGILAARISGLTKPKSCI
ncbi:MAG: TusE/DsrC/DsvC family sulfur relay protein [Gemmatimonadota bacterium]